MNIQHYCTHEQSMELLKMGCRLLPTLNMHDRIDLPHAYDWFEERGVFISIYMNDSFTMYGVAVMEMSQNGECCKANGWYGSRYEASLVGIEIAIDMLNRRNKTNV